ncbi:ABC transporter ATP-binding protein [Marinobacter salinus]|uniref:ABC transporter ATP-binding protein n=1 Tax=Marinobacter salinus TaxID=1874317 RepID=UPI000BFF8A98|nr:ATP-binding cassette domain-containing protein [Marinobacter salinus]
MATLTLEDVSVGALKKVNLSVSEGEIVCVSGASGSGKSRLLRAVADLDPHEGRVALDGESQDSMPGHVWRRQVMMVPADSQWWFDDVGSHFGADADREVPEALGFGPDVMSWTVSRLSSGERQRLAILRGLYRNPRVLLLDEPTANLDDEMTQKVEGWLVSEIRARKLAVIWIAHDNSQIRRIAGRHYRIDGDSLELLDGNH